MQVCFKMLPSKPVKLCFHLPKKALAIFSPCENGHRCKKAVSLERENSSSCFLAACEKAVGQFAGQRGDIRDDANVDKQELLASILHHSAFPNSDNVAACHV